MINPITRNIVVIGSSNHLIHHFHCHHCRCHQDCFSSHHHACRPRSSSSMVHHLSTWFNSKTACVLQVLQSIHPELRTVVIQGFLINAVCRRARPAHLVSQTTKPQPAFPNASQPRGMAQLEVSTCLGSHSPGAQNCGNSRLPHQGRLPTRRISTSGVSNNQDTTSIPKRITTPWHGSA